MLSFNFALPHTHTLMQTQICGNVNKLLPFVPVYVC